MLFDPAETPANKPPEDRDAFIADIKSGCRFFGGESYENSRSAEEKVKFKRALCDTMDLWYSHRGTVVVLVTQMPPGYVTSGGRDYESRGWTTFERCSAELIKPVEAYVVPDGQDVIFGYYLWPMCIDTARVGEAGAGRRPPATPEVFAELMESCSFTNEADVAQVRILYETVATAVLAATDELMLTNMVIKPGSGRHVQLALDMCPNLQKFMLDGSCIEPIDLRQALRAKPRCRRPRCRSTRCRQEMRSPGHMCPSADRSFGACRRRTPKGYDRSRGWRRKCLDEARILVPADRHRPLAGFLSACSDILKKNALGRRDRRRQDERCPAVLVVLAPHRPAFRPRPHLRSHIHDDDAM